MKNQKLNIAICALSVSLIALLIISFSVKNSTDTLEKQIQTAKIELEKVKKENAKKEAEIKNKDEYVEGKNVHAWLQHQQQSTIKKNESNRRSKNRAGIYQPHLKRLIRATVAFLELPDASDWERLVLLTVAAESDMGRYAKQIRGPALGIAQLERPTEKDVLLFLKTKMPETYQKVRQLRFPAKLDVHEAEINMAYAIAMCCGEYLRRGYSPKGKTTDDLVYAYKKHYNTFMGKATIKGVYAKLKEFDIKL